MLLLTRKIGERIVITTPQGQKIVLVLRDVHGGKDGKGWGQIGIDADKDIKILREELIRPQPGDGTGTVPTTDER